MTGRRSHLLILATAALACSANASARPKGLSRDLTVFRCDAGEIRSVPSENQDLIVSLSREMVSGDPDLLTKRSDFSLTDQKKIFGKAKKFTLSGAWPGKLVLTGFEKDVETGRVELAPAPRELYEVPAAWMPAYDAAYPRRAIVTAQGGVGSLQGSCVAIYLTPARPYR